MDKDFFVMLTCQNGAIATMLDGDETATLETELAARECADNNFLGKAFGYEVFERGRGEFQG